MSNEVQRRFRCVLMRGGTSRALVFHATDLPDEPALRDRLFLLAMGSPDPAKRQLDGMGGGVSSLSKVCIVARSTRPGADVDYTFAQVPVAGRQVDYRANCGNMSSAIGPFAVDEGLVVPAPDAAQATVHVFNTNTGKLIRSTFPVQDGTAMVEGEFEIAGVAGTGAPIRLDFLDPAGSVTGQCLPSGRPIDRLEVVGLGSIEVSMVDVAVPMVFLAASALALGGDESPADLDGDAIVMERLEAIRQAASVAMGIAPDLRAAAEVEGVPKLAMLAAPKPYRTLGGTLIGTDQHDLMARVVSMGQVHRATPLTAALCLAAAAMMPGSVVAGLRAASRDAGDMRIGHPSGVMPVTAEVELGRDRTPHVAAATAYRTARRLMQGEVLVPSARLAAGCVTGPGESSLVTQPRA